MIISFSLNIAEGEAQDLLLAQIYFLAETEGVEQQPDQLIIYATEKSAVKIEQYLLTERINFTKEVHEPQNWNALWESNFEPVVVDQFCAIRAHFHTPIDNVQYEIVITPKMSFGTGHHATTFQVIQQMSKLNFAKKRVLDYGAGTGVLAILAEKLGASYVCAMDNDDWSIENTNENMAINRCTKISVHKTETIIDNEYDIVLANINKNVLLANMGKIMAATVPQGTVILSGILTEDKKDMHKALMQYQPIDIQWYSRNNWMSIVIRK
jgi:ribosomal protein L11 methyltransferase